MVNVTMSSSLLQDKVKKFPKNPGVYLMKDSKGKILYVGKATHLRSRVLSYFTHEAKGRYQVQFLMSKVRDIEPILTDTPKEALLLEHTLIQNHRPRYNIELKDDKSFLNLKLSIQDAAPRFYVTRRIRQDGNLYFGPYTSSGACREVLDFIERHFRLRTCSDREYKNRVRPCLQYQIKRCDAPCVKKVSLEDYGKLVEQARLFLEGKNDSLKKMAREKMEQASQQEDFETAARYRDLLRDIELTQERQRVVSHDLIHRDILGFYREGEQLLVYCMPVRFGKWMDPQIHSFQSFESDEDFFPSFLLQFYSSTLLIPQEILLPLKLEAARDLSELLEERAGHGVKVLSPLRGEKKQWMDRIQKNAAEAFSRKMKNQEDSHRVLEDLQTRLGLQKLPDRIECYDISHFQGDQTVGSRVTFLAARPDTSGYRRFHIRQVKGIDDFASLYEVLRRRLRRAQGEETSAWALPDLVVIDGGKGQLHAAEQAFRDEGVEGVDLIALAKSRLLAQSPLESGPRARSEERVFLLGRKDPVFLPPRSSALFLLMQVRDEAHRFGLQAHRQLRKKRSLHSALDEVEGVGKQRRQKLIQTFGSLKGIREARVEDIAQALSVGIELARRIQESL